MREVSKRVAAYLRVSTLDQNPDLQFRELRSYAARRGWSITEYVDRVTGAETRRPQLAALTEALKRHEYSTLLIWKYDRLFRSARHAIEFFELCRHLKVDFVSITEQIDTAGPVGKLIFQIMAAIAEFERDLIRERVIAGMRAAKERGVKIGRPRRALDANRILQDHRLGRSYAEIAREHGASKTAIFRICHGAASERRKANR